MIDDDDDESSPYKGWEIDNLLKKAKDQNMDIVWPEPDEVQIDIDTLAQLDQFNTLASIFRQAGYVRAERRQESKTPGHLHITLTFYSDLTQPERIAIQAILGSDPKRECLNMLRHLDGTEPASALLVAKA